MVRMVRMVRSLADRTCQLRSAEILPGETLAVDIALEPVALEAKPEVYVGLLELVRPVDAADRYAGNPVVIDGREGAHFTAKVGRFRA